MHAVPEDTGYPLKWFKQQESVRNTYQCAICFEVFKDPVQVRDCGHQFCRNCLDGVFRLQSRPRCPFCQKNISKEMVFTDNAAKRAIYNQVVNCPNTGCEWNGQLSSLLKEHTGMCPFLILSCSNVGCNVEVSRRNFNLHLAVCINRTVVCQYCNNGHVFKDKAKHHKSCPYLPVRCRNKCSQKDIPRNQCERHKMEEHLNQEMKDHLELSTIEMSKLKDQHQKDIKKVKQVIAAVHKKDIKKVKQEIAAMHKKEIEKVKQGIAAEHQKDVEKVIWAITAMSQNDLKVKQDIAAVHQNDIEKVKQEIVAVHKKEIEKVRRKIAAVHQKDIEKVRQEIAAVGQETQEDIEKVRQELMQCMNEEDIEKVSQTTVIKRNFNRKLSEAKYGNTEGTIYGCPFNITTWI